jgi:cytochrome c oxidase subunit 1/cytochrome c oxidase subunit I+III
MLINFSMHRRRGALAGPNPWNADTLEWATTSPPKAHAFAHIPTVETLHPLWDNHDEFHDPRNERVLDHGRQTLSTTPIEAEPESISTGEPETILPLLVGLALTGILGALMAKALWVAFAFTVASIVLGAIWMWPHEPETKAHPDTHEERQKEERAA